MTVTTNDAYALPIHEVEPAFNQIPNHHKETTLYPQDAVILSVQRLRETASSVLLRCVLGDGASPLDTRGALCGASSYRSRQLYLKQQDEYLYPSIVESVPNQ
eukprot:6481594-Amphidinium_carterae.1